jgi:hypothetical protein
VAKEDREAREASAAKEAIMEERETAAELADERLLQCCYTVVTLLLHCCYTVVTLLLHCYYTVIAPVLHCCHTAVTQGGARGTGEGSGGASEVD